MLLRDLFATIVIKECRLDRTRICCECRKWLECSKYEHAVWQRSQCKYMAAVRAERARTSTNFLSR